MASVPRLRLTGLPTTGGSDPTLSEVLGHQAQCVIEAAERGHPDVATLLMSHGLRKGGAEATTERLSLDEARMLVAREHGFRDYAEAEARGDLAIDARFEAAADAVVAGDVSTLRQMLDETPGLARARASYPHRATLLHVVAANGIEHTRQWESPRNAPELARALVSAGADPDATCELYGGGRGTTPLCMLVSSSHPAHAGVQADLVEVLASGGASVDGLDDDGLPLWTAITFGYTPAAERLAACGARVDNVVFAAALGRVAACEAWADADLESRSAPASVHRIGAHGPELDPRHLLEYALIYACAHARVAVVDALLARDLDLTVKEPRFQSSALGMARYALRTSTHPDAHQAIIARLEARASRG